VALTACVSLAIDQLSPFGGTSTVLKPSDSRTSSTSLRLVGARSAFGAARSGPVIGGDRFHRQPVPRAPREQPKTDLARQPSPIGALKAEGADEPIIRAPNRRQFDPLAREAEARSHLAAQGDCVGIGVRQRQPALGQPVATGERHVGRILGPVGSPTMKSRPVFTLPSLPGAAESTRIGP
jgi:hypothetical protein